MKSKQKELLKLWWPVSIAVVLMALSTYLFIGKFQEIRQNFLNDNEESMRLITRTVDGDLDDFLRNCSQSMEATVRDGDFYAGVYARLFNDDRDTFVKSIKRTPLIRNGLASDMLTIYEERVVLSGESDTAEEGYAFPEGVPESGMTVCVLPDGSASLAFTGTREFTTKEGRIALTFAAVIDPSVLAANAYDGAEEGEWLVMYSPKLKLLVRSDGNEILSERADASESGTYSAWAGGAAEFLLEHTDDTEYSSFSYVFTDAATGTDHNNTMIVCPRTESKNGEFSIGFAKDLTEVQRQNEVNSLLVMLYTVMFSVGVAILLFQTIRSRQRITQAQMEVENLRAKNEETEKLLEKTNELAHHQRLETIGVMTAGIAHEFNNLMTPIMSCSLMSLEQLDESSPVYDNLVEIYEASRKAKTLVNRLSSVSGKGNVKHEKDIRPAELVNKIIGLTAAIKPKNVTVRSEVNCTAAAIHGDETQLIQLFLNLVINAYHAMENGGELTLTADECGESVVFRVKDTGCGMSEEVKSKIFEPFFTTRESGKGTGLGLAIAAQVITSHNGSIDLESEPDKGTTFTITLPCITLTEETEEEIPAEAAAETAEVQTESIREEKPCTALMIIPQKV